MKIGMLWFNNDPEKTLSQKVIEASRYYSNKYKAEPNLCYVHPMMLSNTEEEPVVKNITIKTSKTVLPNHFWIGVNSS